MHRILNYSYLILATSTSTISLLCNTENIYIEKSFHCYKTEKPLLYFVGRIIYPTVKSLIHGIFWPYFIPRWSYDATYDKRRFLKHFTAVSLDNSSVKTYTPLNFSYPFWIRFREGFAIQF